MCEPDGLVAALPGDLRPLLKGLEPAKPNGLCRFLDTGAIGRDGYKLLPLTVFNGRRHALLRNRNTAAGSVARGRRPHRSSPAPVRSVGGFYVLRVPADSEQRLPSVSGFRRCRLPPRRIARVLACVLHGCWAGERVGPSLRRHHSLGEVMAAASVLLISSDRKTVRSFRSLAERTEVELQVVHSLPEASRLLARRGFDALFVQMDSPGGNVSRWLSDGIALTDRPPTIVFNREGSIRDAVRAMRSGACHYIVKPPSNAAAFTRAIARARESIVGTEPGGQPSPPFVNAFDGFVTADRRLLTVCETVARVAASAAMLVIEGESGTGKSLLAQMLHRCSPRRFAPLVEFRCAPLPERKVEAELFGEQGRFGQADGGTLVLVDAAGLSAELKSRIVGASTIGRAEGARAQHRRAADVRLVLTQTVAWRDAAEPPEADESWGVPAVRVQLPPLRRRVMDIPLLADHFLRQCRRRYGRGAGEFSEAALRLLVHYQWPGNVTELRNAVEHAVILTRGGVVMPTALPARVAARDGLSGGAPADGGPLPLKDALREPERRHILRALNAMGWNKQHAARQLQISRSTLYKKMRELGLDSQEVFTGAAHRS